MITKIVLDKVATYKNKTEINNLKAVNFFYGANGTGKSTIASYLNNPNDTLYSKCTYEPNPISDKIYVFNKKFVLDNFENNVSLKGIYRLGEENIQINQTIADLTTQKENTDKLLKSANENLTIEKTKQQTKETEFIDFCWKQSAQTRTNFDKALPKKTKAEFKNSVEDYLKKNAQTHDLSSLEQRYKTLHTDELSELPEIPYKSTNLPDASILQENIVGKQDVDISALIKKFDNQDWVKRGKEYLQSDDIHCPFCQQTIDNAFKQQLNDYFDESYNKKIEQLKNLQSQYNFFYDAYISNIDKIKENKFLNSDEKSNLDKIKNILENNKSIIEQKSKEPSRTFNMKSNDAFESNIFINKFIIDKNEIDFDAYLRDIINAINLKIKEYNKLVNDKGNEKDKLKNDIWQYLADTFLRSQYNAYLSEAKNIQNKINDLNGQIDKTSIEITKIKNKIKELSKEITNITQTVDEINKSLKSLGFTDFSLCVTGVTQDQYEIIRNSNQNADDVYDTLSEGEKTLIAFLYFCHLLKGSFNDTANSEPKIIVFDDPISSLDSNNLFYVRTFIKEIIEDIKHQNAKKIYNAKQIFILTHNLYFFKEIIYNSKQSTTSYYVVSKCNNLSKIIPNPSSPITNSYELLWQGIKNNDYDCRNNMRRILENYFKFTGVQNANFKEKCDAIEKKLEKNEKKMIFSSLKHFLDDGSHGLPDDAHFANIHESIEVYKEVFRMVFDDLGHIAHYNMMMGIEEDIKKEATEKETNGNLNNIFYQQNATVS